MARLMLEEAVQRFLSYGYGSGYGDGDGSGSGDGDGSGYGYGYGDGSGSGDGDGYGDGYGDGSGSGYGDGDGYGNGIKAYCGEPVHLVDGVQTIIRAVHGNMAQGAILQADLTLKKCYIVKSGNTFAHGETLPEAMSALRAKLFEDMSVAERIEAFLQEFKPGKKYPVKEFYDWHNRLTGSCEMGRKNFAKTHGIDLEHDEMTREEFAELTKDAYGGDMIRQLIDAMEE